MFVPGLNKFSVFGNFTSDIGEGDLSNEGTLYLLVLCIILETDVVIYDR